jgi:hypothetical protein
MQLGGSMQALQAEREQLERANAKRKAEELQSTVSYILPVWASVTSIVLQWKGMGCNL